MLTQRTYEKNYLLILFLHFKLGQLFDIYVNGKHVKVLTENESLSEPKNGDLHFVIISNKIRKRKLETLGYWKQNGIESIVDLSSLPDKATQSEYLSATKRTFTNQEFKDNKLWEYSLYLYNNIMGYRILLRHYLKDRPGVLHRYQPSDCQITIRAKDNNNFFCKNIIQMNSNDHILIECIENFVKNAQFTLVDQYQFLYNNSEMNDMVVHQFYIQQKTRSQDAESRALSNDQENEGGERRSKRMRSHQIYNYY